MDSTALKEERARALDELQTMFSPSLDPEVVKLILTESDYDVNAALEQLFTLSSGSTETESKHPMKTVEAAGALDKFDIQQPQSGASDRNSSMDSGIDVTDGGLPVLRENKPHIEREDDFDHAVVVHSRTVPESRDRSRLPNKRREKSSQSYILSSRDTEDHADVDSSDNRPESFPHQSQEPPNSGLAEYKGSLEKFLKHVAVSDGVSEPGGWKLHEIGDEPQTQLEENEPRSNTTSKHIGKNPTIRSTNGSSRGPNNGALLPLNSRTKDFTKDNSDEEKFIHGKHDCTQVEKKHGTFQGKKGVASTVKMNENPPQIQRHIFAPSFGSPQRKTHAGPHGRGILGDMPASYNMQGPSANFSRGTWHPHTKQVQSPSQSVQQFHQNSHGPGEAALPLHRPHIRHPLAKLLIVMRGLPGSGKSTLAWRLKRNGVILTTDDYFLVNGKYEFDPAQLGQAHEWTQSKAGAAMEKGITPLIIDNTNTQAWEMKPYVSMGLRFGYSIVFREPDTWWKFNIKELTRRNQHGVGFQKIAKMLERYERHVTVEKVMNSNRETNGNFPREAESRHDPPRERFAKPERGGLGASNMAPLGTRDSLKEGIKPGPLLRNTKGKEASGSNSDTITFTDHSVGPIPSSRMVDDSGDSIVVEASGSSEDYDQHEPMVRQPDGPRRPLVVELPGVEMISSSEDSSSKRRVAELQENGGLVPADAFENLDDSGPAGRSTLEETGVMEASSSTGDETAVHASGVSDEDENAVAGLEFLKTCFPDLDCSILESVLSSNDGDLVKTVEVILASRDEGPRHALPAVAEGTSENIPRNEASLGRNAEDNTQNPDVSVPGYSGVPDFPDSFTYAGASGNLAADQMGYRPAKEDTLRDALRRSPEAGPSNAPPGGAFGVQVPGAARSHGPAQTMTSRETTTCTSTVPEAPAFGVSQDGEGGVDSSSCFQLSLEPAVAFHLMEMFGPVSETSLTDDLSPEDLVINVDSAFAKLLYKEWEKSVQARRPTSRGKGGKSKTDVSVPKNAPAAAKPRKFRRLVSDKDSSPSWQPNGPERGTKQLKTDQFRSIMDEELAVELSNAKRDDSGEPATKDIASVLKQQKLHAMFPGVDPVALDEIFAANGSELGPTVEMVKASFGMRQAEQPPVVIPSAFVKPETEMAKQNVAEKSDHQPAVADERSLFFQKTLSEPSDPASGDSFQTLQDPDYRDFRAEASMHYRLRDECFKKAALAFSKKQGELAQVYARQGHEHTRKIKEANERAAAMILQQKNANRNLNEIDLHGLHVSEALKVLEQMLAAWKPEASGDPRSRPSPKVITVVTGRGVHSRGGRARIKPAVMDYLSRNNYRFVERNAGLLEVTLY